jgi:hypothetical protein
MDTHNLSRQSGMALNITRGDRAAREWLKAVRGGEGAEATFRALRKYCALDTRGMVEILVYLQGRAGG